MIAFKEEGGHCYVQVDGTNWMRIDNETYSLATAISNGLMTREHVAKLNETHASDITGATLDNGQLTLTRRDGTNVIQGLQVGNSLVPLLRAEDILLAPSTQLVAKDGKYRSHASADYDQSHVDAFYNKDRSSNYTNSTAEMLSNPTRYQTTESSIRKLFAMHRMELPDGASFDATKKYYLRVKWRFNHANCKFGILFKKGDLFYRYYEEYDSNSAVNTEERLYDLSGLSGNQIVVFCQCHRWWSFATEVHLLEKDLAQQVNRSGTWEQFNTIKDILPQGATYFITDTNAGKGVLATKVGSVWKDTIGNDITSRTYRTRV